MKWFARLNTTSPAHVLWRRKGIRPYSLLNVPFHWDAESHSYVTKELNNHEVAQLMDSPDVRMEIIGTPVPIEIKVEIVLEPETEAPPSPPLDATKDKEPLERKRGRPKSIL